MVKINDKCKMTADEIKQGLMHQWDEYRIEFDRTYRSTDPEITDERKYASCNHIASCMDAIMNFLTKIGFEIRCSETGKMAYDAGKYSTFAALQNLQLRLRSHDNPNNAEL